MSEPDARGFVRCDGCGYLTSPQVKALWGGTCPDCRAGFSTPEHLAELRASIARAEEYFQAVDEVRREQREAQARFADAQQAFRRVTREARG